MREKTVKLIVTFHTTTGAMAMETLCKEKGVAGRLIPVPRVISAGCGLAWCAGLESEQALTALMQQHRIVPQGIYHCLV